MSGVVEITIWKSVLWYRRFNDRFVKQVASKVSHITFPGVTTYRICPVENESFRLKSIFSSWSLHTFYFSLVVFPESFYISSHLVWCTGRVKSSFLV